MWSKNANTPFFNSFWAPSKIFRGLFAGVFQCKEPKNFIISKRKKKMARRELIHSFFYYTSLNRELVVSQSRRNNGDNECIFANQILVTV